MLRQRGGSVVCPSCGNLVGVQDQQCFTCGRWNPGLWGFAPLLSRLGRDLGFTQFVIGGCVILYLLTLIIDTGSISTSGLLNFLSPSLQSLFLFGASGPIPVFRYGRWWTVLSAGWLHGGILHIFFNMMWVRQLAPATSEMYGASRMVIIYTIAGIAGFAASTVFSVTLGFIPFVGGAGYTVGASASIFGLLGALVYYGRRTGSRVIGEQAKSWAIMLLIFGFIMRGVDNWAHLGGFAGGYGAAKFLDPLRPERLDHLIGALICLVLTGIAIAISIVDGLSVFKL
ncbi:MAG: rhomboid family intramembrane serine protease [Acidobacteria bacterium]|nr:MAG: rhomboid family intramembrane serine protease [Acidobacteriota bacterium]